MLTDDAPPGMKRIYCNSFWHKHAKKRVYRRPGDPPFSFLVKK